MLSNAYIDIRSIGSSNPIVGVTAAIRAGGRADARNSRHVPARSA